MQRIIIIAGLLAVAVGAYLTIRTPSAPEPVHSDQTEPSPPEETAPIMQPPVAPRIPHEFTRHGITVEDPYAWLKDSDYPEVNDEEILTYLNAENSYFEHIFEPLQPLVETVYQEIKGRQPTEDESVPYVKNGWWYQWRYAEDAQYRTWYRAPISAPNDWQILLNETTLASGNEYFRLGALSVSPNGERMAYSVDTNGSERYELHIIEIATSKPLTTPITDVISNPIWSSDSNGLVYLKLSEEWRPYQVWHHTVGGDADQLIHEEAETAYFLGLDLSQSEEFVVINSAAHAENESYLLRRDALNAKPTLFAARREGHEYDIDHRHDQFVIRSNRNHSNFDIFTADENQFEEENWTLLTAGGPDIYITGHLALADYLIVQERHKGLEKIRIIADDDTHFVSFDDAAYDTGMGTNPNFVTDTLRLTYTSMATPNTVYDYHIPSRELKARKVQQIPSGFDASQFVTERIFATARDGVEVPVSLVYQRDTPLDGSAPLYLYGYGAYGITIPPSFSTTRLSLLERGFIYAIAHIRGGDDLGYHWYTSGKLTERNNTFNDFVDVAEHLIKENYTRVGNIAIAGGSAGGELMGAVVNQKPELWGAVAAHVPFVDVLNTMLDTSLPLTPLEFPEWGNPQEDPEAFKLIQSYSPYDQLKPGAYPPMLVTAGLNDPRVTYWEPAKYVARLRHLKTDSNPLVLKTNMGAGHGGASGRFDSLRESAEEIAFFLNALEAAEKAGD